MDKYAAIVTPCSGKPFSAMVLDERRDGFEPECLIEYESVVGITTTWLAKRQIRAVPNSTKQEPNNV